MSTLKRIAKKILTIVGDVIVTLLLYSLIYYSCILFGVLLLRYDISVIVVSPYTPLLSFVVLVVLIVYFQMGEERDSDA